MTGVHAGLETAVIGDKVAGLDMISFGPQIEAPHSPDERVSIPTVERFWKLLVGFVDEMSSPRDAMSRWLLGLLIVLGIGTILGVSAAVGNGDNTGETVSASDSADNIAARSCLGRPARVASGRARPEQLRRPPKRRWNR